MILFFRTRSKSVIATEADHKLSKEEISELSWLYGDAEPVDNDQLEGYFVGPRREMVTPWSTNAVEITQNMALKGISRIEEYFPVDTPEADHDPMLQRMYDGLDQQIFTIDHDPEPIKRVDDLEKFNEEEGLALSPEEIAYLHKIEKENGRPLTDSEIFGFAQINSEHCRHKIFGGHLRHRRQGDGVVALQHDQEDHPRESGQDRLRLQGQRGLRPGARHRAVCPEKPIYGRLLPREARGERHFSQGRNPQLPDDR